MSKSISKKEKADAVYKMLTRESNIPEISKSSKSPISPGLPGSPRLPGSSRSPGSSRLPESSRLPGSSGSPGSSRLPGSSGSPGSPGNAKEKNDSKLLLPHLSSDIIKLITDHYQKLLKYELVEWIQESKILKSKILKCAELSSNFYAIDFLTSPKNIKYIDYNNLSKNRNPEALLLITNKIIEEKKLSKTQYDKLKNKINWYELSKNPIAADLLDIYKDDIRWDAICSNSNPKVLKLLKKKIKEDPDEIDWEELSSNSIAIKLLKTRPNDDIDYSGLSANSSDEAIDMLSLKKNIKKIDFAMLSFNKNPKAIILLEKLLKKEPERLDDWSYLSENSLPEAIKILKENFVKIDWARLSSNSSDEAIQLLEDNKDKISWGMLSANTNPKALELLKENQTKIWWPALSANPSIFTL